MDTVRDSDRGWGDGSHRESILGAKAGGFMKLCEGCIKQDVCKFKKEVEEYECMVKLPEPLEPVIECKYKETEPYWPASCPRIWTYYPATFTC